MPSDANLALAGTSASPITSTTTPVNNTAITLPAGTPRRGLKARVIYSAATAASGSDTAQFNIDVSYDGGSTYVATAFAPTIGSLTSTALAGEQFIPFEVSPTSVANQIKVRLTLVLSSVAHTDTITYFADVLLARP